MFDRIRYSLLGVSEQEAQPVNKSYSSETDAYYTAINEISSKNQETTTKGLRGKPEAYTSPMIGNISANPDYVGRPSRTHKSADLHRLLRNYSNNTVLNAIINTRSNQVSLYSQPARYSEKGQGFEIRLKDIKATPTEQEEKEMARIEDFLLNTGKDKDENHERDTFLNFLKKVVRDTYIYDQVNFEKVFDKGKFLSFKGVDPTTIYFGTKKDGTRPVTGNKYVQVIDGRVVNTFTPKEMAFAVRNPRTDIYSAGYGLSELEVGLKTIISHENTEKFNDRFFSHGGTTRGLLVIKSDQKQSRYALDMFKREWQNSLAGINGSWQIPVINAEDAKYVNMSQSARDMQFESWLNYLINLLSSLYGIDPAEINFPNRGGATGSGRAPMNEGNSGDKSQLSQNKGLLPLLEFIESTINQNIISEFSNKYRFQFVGGDSSAEMQKIRILAEKTEFVMTINEAREELGLDPIPGGDVPANGIIIQRLGQLIQEENSDYQKQQDRLNQVLAHTGTGETTQASIGLSFQDIQQGLAGNAENVDGRDTTGPVGKDGQDKEQENTNKPQ